MKIGSLFSGIGGLELGLERAGMTVAWQSEIDPFACRVLAKHWPDVPNLGDITKIEWSTVEPVDLICGGYPCQPFSLSGKRRGGRDNRHLWPFLAVAVRDLRPRWVVLENVTGHLSLGFGQVLGDLAALGYDAEWDCLPASAFGAPHRRERLAVVAYPTGSRLEGRIFTSPPRQAQSSLPGGLGRAGAHWEAPPEVPRVGYGLPDWVDRVRATGNAVVPQVAEWIGRRIMAADLAAAS